MTPPADAAARIAALEAELARVTFERDALKSTTYALLERLFPYRTPTPEEIQEMMHGPRGESLAEIVSEYESQSAAHGH